MSIVRSSSAARAGLGAAVLATAGLALPTAASAASARPGGSVTVSVAKKAPAASALRSAKVKLTASKPASASRTRWKLPVDGEPRVNATRVELSGKLKFSRGKRSVTVTKLRLSLGKKPTISGTVGKKRVTLLTLTGAPTRKDAAGTIDLKKARTSLSPAAVRVLRSKLSARKLRSGRLGTTTLAIRTEKPTPPAPPAPPAPVTPPVAFTPPIDVVVPTPAACWTSTPSGVTDWVACDPAIGGNHFSFIRYLTGGGGSVTPLSSGATVRVKPDSPYDYRLGAPTTSASGGEVTLAHDGGVRYLKPAFGIDILLQDLRIVVSSDRRSARVRADGSYVPRPDLRVDPPVFHPAVPFADKQILTIDLSAARSTSAGADPATFTLAPARLTEYGSTVFGATYGENAPFGAFTITVPAS